jgi:exosortase/archaeosortase
VKVFLNYWLFILLEVHILFTCVTGVPFLQYSTCLIIISPYSPARKVLSVLTYFNTVGFLRVLPFYPVVSQEQQEMALAEHVGDSLELIELFSVNKGSLL